MSFKLKLDHSNVSNIFLNYYNYGESKVTSVNGLGIVNAQNEKLNGFSK